MPSETPSRKRCLDEDGPDEVASQAHGGQPSSPGTVRQKAKLRRRARTNGGGAPPSDAATAGPHTRDHPQEEGRHDGLRPMMLEVTDFPDDHGNQVVGLRSCREYRSAGGEEFDHAYNHRTPRHAVQHSQSDNAPGELRMHSSAYFLPMNPSSLSRKVRPHHSAYRTKGENLTAMCACLQPGLTYQANHRRYGGVYAYTATRDGKNYTKVGFAWSADEDEENDLEKQVRQAVAARIKDQHRLCGRELPKVCWMWGPHLDYKMLESLSHALLSPFRVWWHCDKEHKNHQEFFNVDVAMACDVVGFCRKFLDLEPFGKLWDVRRNTKATLDRRLRILLELVGSWPAGNRCGTEISLPLMLQELGCLLRMPGYVPPQECFSSFGEPSSFFLWLDAIAVTNQQLHIRRYQDDDCAVAEPDGIDDGPVTEAYDTDAITTDGSIADSSTHPPYQPSERASSTADDSASDVASDEGPEERFSDERWHHLRETPPSALNSPGVTAPPEPPRSNRRKRSGGAEGSGQHCKRARINQSSTQSSCPGASTSGQPHDTSASADNGDDSVQAEEETQAAATAEDTASPTAPMPGVGHAVPPPQQTPAPPEQPTSSPLLCSSMYRYHSARNESISHGTRPSLHEVRLPFGSVNAAHMLESLKRLQQALLTVCKVLLYAPALVDRESALHQPAAASISRGATLCQHTEECYSTVAHEIVELALRLSKQAQRRNTRKRTQHLLDAERLLTRLAIHLRAVRAPNLGKEMAVECEDMANALEVVQKGIHAVPSITEEHLHGWRKDKDADVQRGEPTAGPSGYH